MSTDDVEIADISKEYGAEVPFMRPKSISDDYATLSQVQEHAINELQFDGKYICMILPTAPMIQSQYILKGFKEIQKMKLFLAFLLVPCHLQLREHSLLMKREPVRCIIQNFKKKSRFS